VVKNLKEHGNHTIPSVLITGDFIMAIVPKGGMFDGMRGRLGDLVFRVQGEQTIVSHRPKRPKTPPEKMSEARRNNQIRFQQAVEFARDARHRSAFRSLSRLLRSHSPYHIALQDYLSEPEILLVETSGGDQPVLTIQVSERVAVRSVRIRRVKRKVESGSGSEIGAAALADEKRQSDPIEPKPQERRLPPAATFFQKVETSSTPTTSLASGSAAPAAAESQRVIQAYRISELNGPRDFKNDPPNIEVWQARVPWSGEVEIVASDYAGNRAIRLLQIINS
jgi:hypothetical protein